MLKSFKNHLRYSNAYVHNKTVRPFIFSRICLSSSSIPFTVLASQLCNLSRYHSYVNVTQSIVDSWGLDRARISFHRHSSLFQDHGVDRCVTYLLVPRAFTPWTRRTHLESLIQSLTSPRAFLNRVRSSLFPSLPPSPLASHSPPLSFPFSFFLPLFLFPPFVTARHWTWLGLVSFVNGIFSVALHVGKGSSQAKWNSRLRSFCGENGGEMNEFDGSIGKFELANFNLTLTRI